MPADGAILGIYLHSGTQTSTNVVDIGLGTAGAEVLATQFSCAGSLQTADGLYMFPAPYPVAAGTRVAFRVNCGTGVPTTQLAKLIYITSRPASLEFAGGGSFTTPVENVVSPSATLWVNGSWVQLTASLAATAYLWAATIRTGLVLPNTDWELDIGTGAAGSEVVLATFRWTFLQNFSNSIEMSQHIHPVGPVTAGTRVAARVRANSGSTLDVRVGANFQA